jgi:hypothetical protein
VGHINISIDDAMPFTHSEPSSSFKYNLSDTICMTLHNHVGTTYCISPCFKFMLRSLILGWRDYTQLPLATP